MLKVFRKDERGVVAIEAAIVFAGLIIPCLLGSIYIAQLAATKAGTAFTAAAVAGVAGRIAQATDGTHAAGETAGQAVFAANKASFFADSANVQMTLTWGANNLATVKVSASLPSLLGGGISASTTATD